MFERIKSYLLEVKGEAGKVSWPGRRELVDSTFVVIAFIFILAVTTLVCDKVIQAFIDFVVPKGA
jgi:preprotein translocase SecE subunit